MLGDSTECLSTEDIIVLEQQFLTFTEQNGPVVKLDTLHDLLIFRCGEKTITRQELADSLGSWNPDLSIPLTLKQFINIITDVKTKRLLAGPRSLSQGEAETLFDLLSGQTEFIPTRVAIALSAVLESESFLDNYLDYIGLDGFVTTVLSDPLLSRRMAVKKAVLMRGALNYGGSAAAFEHDINLVSAPPDDSETLEAWYRVNEGTIEAVLREAHLLVQRDEMARLERQRKMAERSNRTMLSYFSPQEVVPTGGASMGTANVSEVRLQARRPASALDHFSDEITSQTLVGRVAELRRLRKQKVERAVEAQRQAEEEERERQLELEAKGLESTTASNQHQHILLDQKSDSDASVDLGDTMTSRPTLLQRVLTGKDDDWESSQARSEADSTDCPSHDALCPAPRSMLYKESTGYKVTNRLFPHARTPVSSIQQALKQKIGLSWDPDNSELPPRPSPFTPWREYKEYHPKPRRMKTNKPTDLFFRPEDPLPLELNYHHEMPPYRPPTPTVNKSRLSASGVPLDNISFASTAESRRRKRQQSLRRQREKIINSDGPSMATANSVHEASLLLLDARAALKRTIERSNKHDFTPNDSVHRQRSH